MRAKSFQKFFRWFYRNRSLRLTSEGTRFLLLTIAVGVAAINTGNNLFYLLLAMMLSLIVISGLLSEQCLRKLTFKRYLPNEIFANQPAMVTLSITNHKLHLPSFSLGILDVVDDTNIDRGLYQSHLRPHSSALLSYPLLLKRRGYHCLDGIKVVTRFPFGLFLKGAYYAGESQILVYPELKHVPDAVIQNLAVQGHEQPLSRRGPGTDLYNLRLYHPGDDSRTIHWMTTARTAQLMIRETEAEDQRRITLALSTIAPVSYEECFERGVTLAASLVAYFHERGYAIRALVGPQDIPLRWDEEHVRSILRALALCERVSPSNDDSIAAAFHSLRQDDQADACTIAILPWPDVQLVTMCQGFQHLIHVAEDKEYLDAARPGVPA